jgi:hypothetical protein
MINDLYTPPTIFQVIKSRRMRWAGHVAHMGRGDAYIGFWLGNLRERGPLERPGLRWKDNIKMDLQEVACVIMD